MAPDLSSNPHSLRNTQSPHPANMQQPTVSTTRSQTPLPSSRQSSTTPSRRASLIFPMSPPPLPLASPGGSIPSSVQHSHSLSTFPPLSPSLSGNSLNVDASVVPMRHPRPLTAAELHHELEKEQEAVVNRLTRELSALRAHSASVASTSSNTSGVLLDGTDPSFTGPTHPTQFRRHRSSSSVSRNSVSTPYTGPTAYSTGIPLNPATVGIPHSHHRYSVSSQPATSDPNLPKQQSRSTSVVSTPRYEEHAYYKHELEEAKRENERLKKKIKELERMINEHAIADNAVRGRSSGGTPRNGVIVPVPATAEVAETAEGR
ncbi:hypothetical protein GQ43DRAFT_445094 [Delitschia confertaspora ATCC 74209]|uniref:Uncharacterized protein n=1 Tax=Delitschia confertaspora ATCC 74209 TaxID=1513339 RepID=A0A9P4JBJ1_9PLEO|nr:hypothetical protein GQ43DRAFT_445094 [Delitschia confertaspora ATCC 74209]